MSLITEEEVYKVNLIIAELKQAVSVTKALQKSGHGVPIYVDNKLRGWVRAEYNSKVSNTYTELPYYFFYERNE